MAEGSRSSLRLFVALAAALPLLIALATSLYVRAREAEEQAETLAARAVEFREHMLRVFDASRLILRAADQFRDRADPASLYHDVDFARRTRELIDSYPHVRALFVLDTEGRTVASTQEFPAPAVSFAEAEFFTAQIAVDQDLFIGGVSKDPSDGMPVIHVSTRLTDEQGRFSGVAALSLPYAYFIGYFRSLIDEQDLAAVVTRHNGERLVRFPETPLGARGTAGNSALVAARAAQSAEFRMVFPNASDGRSLLYEFRRLDPFQATVGIGARTDAVDGRLKPVYGAIATFALMSAGALAAAVLAVGRRFAQQAEDAERQRRLVGELEREVALRERLHDRALALATAAEAASTAKSSFLATMSHELRTPLNAIIGFAQMMGLQTFGPIGHRKYAEYVADIEKSGAHLLDLIDGVLDFSKAELGAYRFEIRPVALDALFAAVLDILKPMLSDKRLTAAIDPHPGALAASADERALRQICLNLLSNAIKFTPAGGTIRLGAFAAADPARVVLRVADDGFGIAPEDLARIGQPFFQADTPYRAQNRGSGLGLAICRVFAERMGGGLAVESRLGDGTTVSVELPRAA
jgi:signal transduction histidine kinase